MSTLDWEKARENAYGKKTKEKNEAHSFSSIEDAFSSAQANLERNRSSVDMWSRARQNAYGDSQKKEEDRAANLRALAAMSYKNSDTADTQSVGGSSALGGAEVIPDYDEQKTKLRNEKNAARKGSFEAALELIGAKLSGDEAELNQAEHHYESAKGKYARVSNAHNDLKQNKWNLVQERNQGILSEQPDVAELVKTAYVARQNSENTAQSTAAFTGTNPILIAQNQESNDKVQQYDAQYAKAMKQLADKGYDAESLLDTYTRGVNAAQQEKISATTHKFAEEHPIGASAGSVLMTPMEIMTIPQGAATALTAKLKDEYIPVDTNSKYFTPTNVKTEIRSDVGEQAKKKAYEKTGSEKLSDVAGFAYQTAMSMGDSALAATLPGASGSLMLGSSAYASTLKDATDRGLSADKAFATAAAAGVAETAFEAISIDKFKIMAGSDKKGIRALVENITKQMVTEGSEELNTDIANAVTDYIINGDMSELSLRKQALINEGYDEVTANKVVAQEFGKQLGESFIGGALSGGVFGAGASVSSRVNYNVHQNSNYSAAGAQLKEDAAAQQTINEGLSADPSGKEYKLAAKLQNRLDQNAYENNSEEADYDILSDTALGKLSSMNQQRTALAEFSDNVSDEENAAALTKIYTKILEGKTISNAEAHTFRKSAAALEALNNEFDLQLTADDVTAKSLSELGQAFALRDVRNYNETESVNPNSRRMELRQLVDKADLQSPAIETQGVPRSAADTIEAYAAESARRAFRSENTQKAFVEGYAGTDAAQSGASLADYADGFYTVYEKATVALNNHQALTTAEAVELGSEHGLSPEQSFLALSSAQNDYNAAVDKTASVPKKTVGATVRGKEKTVAKQTVYLRALKNRTPGVKTIDAPLTAQQRREVRILDDFAKAKGLSVVVVDSVSHYEGLTEKVNGISKNGNIILSLDADGGTILPYAGHELFHTLKDNKKTSADAEALEAFILEELNKDAAFDYEARVDELKKLYGTEDMAVINEEIAANACFTVLSKEENFGRLVKDDVSLAKKVKSFFASFLERLRKQLKNLTAGGRYSDYRVFEQNLEAQQKVVEMMSEMLEEYETGNHENGVDINKVSYSFAVTQDNNTYVELSDNTELAEMIKNSSKSKHDIIKDYIIDVFYGKELQLSDGKIAIIDKGDAKKLSRMTNDRNIAEISKLREAIKKAQLASEAHGVEHKKFTDFYYYNFAVKYGNKIYNMVLNVGFGKFDSKYHIYAITNDMNKRKVADSKSPAGSVDNLLKSDFSTNNISQNEGKRNTEKSISELDTAGRTLTDEQQKYFKDSKVRNNAGRLRVMYHGTDADTFTVFDKKMIGSNFTGAFGNGFYFSAKRSDAKGFGKNIIRAYLNIKNPYYAKSSDAGFLITDRLIEQGYDGVIMGDMAVAFYENQVKRIDNTNPTENKDVRYSVSEDDKSYQKAVDSGNEEQTQRLVDNAAMRWGAYSVDGKSPLKLYHGTQHFGFTEFDLSRMDDKHSIFLTSDLDTASTYSASKNARSVNSSVRDINQLSPQELAEYLTENNPNRNYKGMNTEYSYLSKEDINGITDRAKNTVVEIAEEAGRILDEHRKELERREINSLESLSIGSSSNELSGISTSLWMIQNHTDAGKYFNIDLINAEQTIRLGSMFQNRFRARSLDTSEGIILESSLNGYSFTAYDIKEAIKLAESFEKSGNYSLYAKLNNPLIVDGQGENWNKIPALEYEFTAENGKPYKTEYTDTRAFAKYAHQMGYDGVVFKNIVDNGGAIYEIDDDLKAAEYIIVAFNPENVKSADAVTYNDAGEVIPLSERFTDSKDIRYSKSENGKRSDYSKALNKYEWKKFYNSLNSLSQNNNLRIGDNGILITSETENGNSYKLVCYEQDYNGKIEIQSVYKLENYDYNIHEKQSNIVNILVRMEVEYGSGEQAIKDVLRNYRRYNEQTLFRKYNNKSGKYVIFGGNNAKSNAVTSNNFERTGVFESNRRDVNYSRSEHFATREEYLSLANRYWAIEDANELLQEQIDIMNGKRAVLNTTKLERVANSIIKEYGSSLGKMELANQLKSLYSFIADSGLELDGDYLWQQATDIAKRVARSSTYRDTSMYDTYKDFRKSLRTTPVWMSASELKELKKTVDTSRFRFVNYGADEAPLTAVPVDVFYQEALEIYPGLLDDDISNPADMALQMIDAYDATAPEYIPAYAARGIDEDEFARLIAIEIIENYYDMPEVSGTQQKQMNALRMRYDSLREELKAEYGKRLAEQKEKYRSARYADVERRSKTEIRHKILNIKKRLDRKLLNPSDTSYVPVNLVKSVVKVCEAINNAGIDYTDGQGEIRDITNAVNDLSRQYSRLAEDDDFDYKDEYDAVTQSNIDFIAESFSNKTLSEMDLVELEQVYNVLRDIEQSLVDATKQIGYEEWRTNKELNSLAVTQTRASTGYRKVSIGKLERDFINVERGMRKITDYQEDAVLWLLYQQLNDGVRKQNKWIAEVSAPFDELKTRAKENKHFTADLVKTDFVDIHGRPVEMTEAELVQLYLTLKRRQGRVHLEGNGFVLPNRGLAQRGKFKDAVTQGVKVRSDNFTDMSQADINKLYNSLSDYAKEWTRYCEHLFNVQSSEAINSVSLQLKHRKIATAKNYIPIRVNADDIANRELEGLRVDLSVQGMGMLKETQQNARQQLIISGIEGVVNDHIKSVSKYYGLAIPIRNYNKVLFAKNDVQSLPEAVKSKWGEKAYTEFIEKPIVDLQSSRKSDNNTDIGRAIQKVQSNFVKGTLNMNMSVAMKQAASYPTALATLSYKSLAKGAKVFGYSNKKLQQLWDEIDAVTGANYIRRSGLNNEALGVIGNKRTIISSRVTNELNPWKWIQVMDVRTTTALWEACKAEVRGSNKNLDESSREYIEAVKQLYEQTIEQTQPNYDVLHRPEIQKTKNELLRASVMFKTQPLQNHGMIYDAFSELQIKHKQYKASGKDADLQAMKRAQRQWRKAVGAQFCSALTFATMSLVSSALLHKMFGYRDDDKEVTAESVAHGFSDSLISTLISVIAPVGGSEVYEGAKLFLERLHGEGGYSSETEFMSVPVVATVNDFVESMSNAARIFGNDNSTREQKLKCIKSLAVNTAIVFGFPAKNAWNIGEGIVLHVKDIVDGIERGDYEPFEAGVQRNNSEQILRYSKYRTDDANKARSIVNEMLADKETEYLKKGMSQSEAKQKAKESVRNAFLSYYEKPYKEAYLRGDKTEMNRITNDLTVTGLMQWKGNQTLPKKLQEWKDAAKENS